MKLRKYYKVLKKKIMKFLSVKREKQEVKHLHVCKYCGVSFGSGRELGGHMSRKHNGKSQIYKHKTEVHRIN